MHDSVACPHCKMEFKLSEAISKDLETLMRNQVEKDYKKREDALKQNVKNSENEVLELSKKYEREKEDFKKKADLEKSAIERRLEDEKMVLSQKAEQEKSQLRKLIEAEAVKKAEDKYLIECTNLRNSVDEQEKRLKESQQNELKLLSRQRELEQKEKKFELEMQKQLLEHEKVVSENVRREVGDEINLKMAAKDKVVEDMKREMASMQRKLEQGSQQLQGEVLELKIEELIRDLFPGDEVTEVKKGARGSDLLHKVMMSSSRSAGLISIECKDVKEWSPQWPVKLKEDLREKGGDFGLIVTTALPKEIKAMGIHDGVWVCTPALSSVAISMLRELLLRTKKSQLISETSSEAKDILFSYMTSQKFAHKVQGIGEKVDSMKQSLETEKRSMSRIWKKREEDIDMVWTYLGEMYGELESVVGKALPKVDALELNAPQTQDE